MAGGQVWIPVNASMKGFATTVAQEAAKAAGAGGRQLETGFRKSGEAAGEAAASGLAAQASKVDAASRALATARNAEVQATSDVALAEEKLRQLRESGSYTMGELTKAETALEVAKDKSATASERVAAREADLNSVREGGDAASRQLIRAEDQLAAARAKQIEAAGRARAAEEDLEDAQQDAYTAAERVEDATIALANVRDRYGADSREAVDAERELARAQKDSDKAALDLVKSQGAVRKTASDLANAQDDAKSKTMLLEGVQRDLADAERLAAQEADKAANSVSNLGDEMDSAADKGGGFGGRLVDGFKRVGSGMLLGVGAQIGSTVTKGIGTAFEAGFARLQSVEQAGKMLEGLGHSAQGIDAIMDSAMDSVSGTAYGFGEAASMAATFAGAGIEQGEELTRVLSLVGDSAAITGADFQEMGSIWTKMASSGRLSTEEMNQLMDRGLGLLPELQKHYNVTADEARKMVSDGKVSFEDFSEIMEGMVGGSAQAMGDTFSGSSANMRAALGRLGAKFLEPVFNNAPAIFQAVGGAVDKLGKKLDPLIKEWSDRLQPVFENFAERLGPALESAIDGTATVVTTLVEKGQALNNWFQENRTWIEPLIVTVGGLVLAYQAMALQMKISKGIMAAGGLVKWISKLSAVTKVNAAVTKVAAGAQRIFNTVMKANPIVRVISILAALTAGVVWFFTKTETGRELWSKFTDALGGGIDWLKEKFGAFTGWISTAWDGITSLFKGDFSSSLREAFGVEEDNPMVRIFLKAHEILTGIPDLIKGVGDILFKGDFSGLPFGLEEDSGFVNFLFTVRDVAIKTGEIIKAVFDGIVTVGKWAVAIVGAVVLTPLMIAWNLLSSAVQWGWENLIKPAWEHLQSAATWMWESVLMPVFDFIKAAWQAVGDGIQWAYQNLIVPAWNALQSAAQWMWNGVLMPVFGFIKSGWELLATGIKFYYDNVILVAWNALQVAATWMWNNVLMPTFGYIKAGWQALGDGIRWVYDNVILVAWNALQAALNWMYESVIKPVLGWIGDRWNDMGNVLHAGYEWIRDKVFGGLQAGLDVVKSAFELARDAIGKAWDGIKAKAAAPVKFVIDTVFNNGIVEAWNKVADWVDLPTIKKYEPAWLGNYSHGTASIVPGPRSVNRDNVEFISRDGQYGIGLAGGEGIAHQHVVDGLGGKSGWDRLNKIGRTQGPAAVRSAVSGGAAVDPQQNRIRKAHGFFRGGLIDLGNFAYGGTIDAMVNIVRQKYPNIRLTDHYRPGAGPYHGTYQATDWATAGAFGNSAEQLSLAQDIAKTYPGSAELIYDHPGWTGNIKNGSNVGAFGQFYTMAQAGPHDHHVHWAMTDAPTMPFGGGVFEGGSSGTGGGGVINWLRNRVADVLDGIFGPIGNAIPEFGGAIGALPKAAFEKMTGSVSDFIRGKADEAGTGSGVDTSGVVGSNVEIGQQLAARVGWTGAEWDALKELWTLESQWDNHAQNPSSTAYGIPQFLDQTWATVGYGKTSDPATQIAAGIKYIQQRPDYGGLPSKALAAWWSRNPHWYDQGGEAKGKGFLAKDTIKPERVLSPEQTRAFNDWMRGSPHVESAAVIAKELAEAFYGGDWGDGELASVIGSKPVAKAIIDGSAALGELTRAATPILEDAGKSSLKSGLDLFGMGDVVDIVGGVASKIHSIATDDEVQEAIKTVRLDPDGRYSGHEIEKKLKKLGIEVERIKSELDGGILGGLNIMV